MTRTRTQTAARGMVCSIDQLASGAGVRVLSSREGLFADDLYAVAVDDEGRIWLQSDAGEVAVYDRQVLLPDLPR